MSTLPRTASTSSPTSFPLRKSESSTSVQSSSSSSPPRPRRKSPPPPKLNLNELKPILPASFAPNAATSFVFTSSRSIKTLHNRNRSASDAVLPAPNVDPSSSPHSSVRASPSPNTSPIPSPTSPHTQKNAKPSLSPSQLARHSQGAVDARCIVSPNMRAAGFVPLAYTPLNPPTDSSMPPTPGSACSVPTPIDPPRFPPIVFVNPSSVTTTPMWEYQRNLAYGLALSSPSGLGLTTADVAALTRASMSTAAGGSEGSFASSPFDRPSRFPNPSNASQSSFYSSSNASSPQTSFVPLSSSSPTARTYALRHHLRSPDPPVDGYPFPHTPPRTPNQSQSRSQVHNSPVQVPESITPSSSNTDSMTSGSITPLAASPITSVTSLPPPFVSTTPGDRDTLSPASSRSSRSSGQSSFKSRSSRTNTRSALSITELCLTSPLAWVADPVLLAPVAPTNKEATKAGNNETFSRTVHTSSSKESKRENKAVMVLKVDDEESAALQTSEEAGDPVSHPPSPMLLPPAVLYDANEVHIEKVTLKEKERHHVREKGRDHAPEKERDRERRRQKGKTTRSHSSSPTTTPSPEREDKSKEPTPRKPKDRSRSTKEKALAHSAYSSFSFPPRDAQAAGFRAHVLGGRDVILERERTREAAVHAKDIVLAHRERDREYARQAEIWHSERVVHGIHKKRPAQDAALATPHTFATAYDFGYGRGDGRGRGRGEHSGLRGRSGKNMVSVAPSIISDDETMVQEQLDSVELELESDA